MTDIVDMMCVFYSAPTSSGGGGGAAVVAAFSELTIAGWRAYAAQHLKSDPHHHHHSQTNKHSSAPAIHTHSEGSSPPPPRRLIAIDPEDNLIVVSRKLQRHGIHHLPILDLEQNAVVAVLSHGNLLTHILSRFTDIRKLLDAPLYCLGVGSFREVVVVPDTASVISVLTLLSERAISSVPVVNAMGQVVDLYGRNDVGFLSNDPSLMVLDAPIGEVRKAQMGMVSVQEY